MADPQKTGEVYSRDPDGSLWICESFVDEHGEVSTTRTCVEPAPVTDEID
jgi:hypothetical protein